MYKRIGYKFAYSYSRISMNVFTNDFYIFFRSIFHHKIYQIFKTNSISKTTYLFKK